MSRHLSKTCAGASFSPGDHHLAVTGAEPNEQLNGRHPGVHPGRTTTATAAVTAATAAIVATAASPCAVTSGDQAVGGAPLPEGARLSAASAASGGHAATALSTIKAGAEAAW